MRKEEEYRARCAARGLGEAALSRAVASVEALEAEAVRLGIELDAASLPFVEAYVAALASRGEAGEERITALARYFLVTGVDAVAIRLMAYLLPVGVLPAMAGRLAELEGPAARDRVMAGVAVPPAGSPPEAYPAAAAAFTLALEAELGSERAARVLAWNVHAIPAAAFAEERERFLAAASVEDWLAGYHERQVAVLERHAADGTLWFEQRITPAVVAFVRGNPEILGGVRSGNRVLATKIPYDPGRFLASTDPLERRRLACHCPFAASSIEAGTSRVPALWCSCSAGFEKYMFEVVFGEETECEILESVLAGDESCRFAIRIPEAILMRDTAKRSRA